MRLESIENMNVLPSILSLASLSFNQLKFKLRFQITKPGKVDMFTNLSKP